MSWHPAPEYKLWETGDNKDLGVAERTLASVSEGMVFKWIGFVLNGFEIFSEFSNFFEITYVPCLTHILPP